MSRGWVIRSALLLIVASPVIFLIYYIYYRPMAFQREAIGHSLAGANSLSSFDMYEYNHRWVYSLKPGQKARAESYCLKPAHFVGERRAMIQQDLEHDRCIIAARNGADGNLISIELVGNDLVVRKYNHPDGVFRP